MKLDEFFSGQKPDGKNRAYRAMIHYGLAVKDRTKGLTVNKRERELAKKSDNSSYTVISPRDWESSGFKRNRTDATKNTYRPGGKKPHSKVKVRK